MRTVSTLLVTRVRLHATRLDGEIADGADPMATGERAARAAQLLQPRMRHGLARGLRRAVLDARRTACVRSVGRARRPFRGLGLRAVAAGSSPPSSATGACVRAASR